MSTSTIEERKKKIKRERGERLFWLFKVDLRSDRTAETLLQDPLVGSDQQAKHTPILVVRMALDLPCIYVFQ